MKVCAKVASSSCGFTNRHFVLLLLILQFLCFVFVTLGLYFGKSDGYDIFKKTSRPPMPASFQLFSGLHFQSMRKNKSLFSNTFGKFEWENYIYQVQISNSSGIDASHEILIHLLQDFVILEPTVPIRSDCHPPPLLIPTRNICSSYSYGNAFTGKVNLTPPKIGVLVTFGFDVDQLEIHLNEVYDVVDRFFIMESTKSHFRGVRKPLIWEKVKDQNRFLKFTDKVVHFVMDDAESSEAHSVSLTTGINTTEDARVSWNMETTQEQLRWTKFVQWNKHYHFFSSKDLLGFGDTDEIPARRTIQLLKHCSLNSGIVDIGIWFPFGNIKYAYKSDFKIHGHPYTLGDPTFFTLQDAMKFASTKGQFPTRRRGSSGTYVLGGAHLSSSAYLPFALIKALTCTECSFYSDTSRIELIAKRVRSDELAQLEFDLRTNISGYRISRLEELGGTLNETAILPWFYDCNRERYPVWEGKHDTRLD